MQPSLADYQAAIDRVLATPSAPSHDELSNSLIARLLVSLDRLDADIAAEVDTDRRHRMIRLQTVIAAELNRISRDQGITE